MKRGQVALWIPIAGGIATVIASAFGAFATANSALFEVKQDVAVVQEREANHFDEVQKSLSRIEKKLDMLAK